MQDGGWINMFRAFRSPGPPVLPAPNKPMSKRKVIWLGLAALIVIIFMYGSRAQPAGGSGSDRKVMTPADSARVAVSVCGKVLRDKLTAPETVEIEPFSMKRDPNTHTFVGAGQATAANPAGVKVTHEFVCIIDTNRDLSNVILRSQNRVLYNEMIKVFDL